MSLEQSKYTNLINEIGSLLQMGREQASQAVNTILVQTYWLIGKHIVEFEQEVKRKRIMAVNFWISSQEIYLNVTERGLAVQMYFKSDSFI